MSDSHTPDAPRPPFKVRKALKAMGVNKVEWDMYEDDKWFGYCEFGEQRVAITVSLVTGKAVVEILAPIVNEDILL